MRPGEPCVTFAVNEIQYGEGKMSEKKLSRREFIKDAAVAGAAIAAAGTFIPEPVLAAPGVPEKWDKETDVIVVGYGGAGAAATIEATKAGAKVIVLERMKQGGGSTAISGGVAYMGGGTPLQKALKIEDSRDAMFKYVMQAAGDGADEELVGLFCDQSLDLYNWLDGLGLKFNESLYPNKTPTPPGDQGLYYSGNEQLPAYEANAKAAPRGHHAPLPGNAGPALFKPIAAAVAASGAEVIFEALAKQLVIDKNGRVVGVVVTVGGQDKFYKANRGVVLAAGGFGANKAMVGQHAPAFLRAGGIVGTAGDDGSGIKMGQSVGGDVRGLGNVFGYATPYNYSEALCKGIYVNDRAVRFIAEDSYGSFIGEIIVRDNPVAYLIWDDGIWSQVPDAIKKAIKLAGQANTVAELATALKVSPLVLENTINLYNTMATNGDDLLFKKSPKFLAPLKTPPFYAMAQPAASVYVFTLGGLRIDKNAQVLDTAGKAVPGLYAAGRNAYAVSAQHYPASGVSVSEVLIFGRIAGKNAAAEKPAV